MAASNSLYQCLYLTSSASKEQIHESYEQAVLFWTGQPGGSEYLKSVCVAYNILSDPMTRAAYDTYGLSSILEDESSYRESTPLPTPQLTPQSTPLPTPQSTPQSTPLPTPLSTPLSTHTQATIPAVEHPGPKVAFQLPEDEERKKERREMRRMLEPEEEKRRKSHSSSKSEKKDRTEKGDEGSTVHKNHKSSSKSQHDKKRSGSESTSRWEGKTSSKDERSKDASRSGGSKEQAHWKFKRTNSLPHGQLHNPLL